MCNVRQSLIPLAAGVGQVAASVLEAFPRDSLMERQVELQLVLRLLENRISSHSARCSCHGVRKRRDRRDRVEVSLLQELPKLAVVSALSLDGLGLWSHDCRHEYFDLYVLKVKVLVLHTSF